jgi:hypothetical protein
MTHSRKRLTLGTPATYRIHIQGTLDESWSSRLGGMTIAPASQEGEPPLTVLVGHLIDQAALLGVVNFLYDLGQPLLSVECLEIQEED